MMRSMLQGKTIAFTGDLGAMTRKEATAAAQAVGAKVSSSVTQATDFLVAGEGATMAKQAKAQANGISILSAPQFVQSVSGATPAPAPRTPAPVKAAPVATYAMPMSTGPIEYPPEALAHQASLVAARKNAGLSPYDAQNDQDFDEDHDEDEQPEEQPAFVHGTVNVADKTVAITGTLGAYTRAEAIARLQRAGAHVMSNVSGNTDYLVCGANATESKIQAAHRKGVSLISESQFTAATNVPVATHESQTPAAAYASHNTNISFAHKSISITGTLANYSRAEATVYAKQAGATVTNKVTGNTSYLVVGANPTPSKVAEAQQKGVMIVAEHQFAAAVAVAPVKFTASTSAAPAPVQSQVADAEEIDEDSLEFTEEEVTLPGKVIAITGTLDGFTRAEASAQAKMIGATITSSVNANTDYLVCGYGPTPKKVHAAEANGVELVSEEQFADAIAIQNVTAPVATPRGRKPAAAPQQQMQMQAPAQQPVAAHGVVAQGPVALAGKTILFTGTMDVNRLVAAVMATKSGASVSTNLSTKVDYVVVGSNPGAKLQQAQQLGLTLLTESQFVASCHQ